MAEKGLVMPTGNIKGDTGSGFSTYFLGVFRCFHIKMSSRQMESQVLRSREVRARDRVLGDISI